MEDITNPVLGTVPSSSLCCLSNVWYRADKLDIQKLDVLRFKWNPICMKKNYSMCLFLHPSVGRRVAQWLD
jgi:hypothetical protein